MHGLKNIYKKKKNPICHFVSYKDLGISLCATNDRGLGGEGKENKEYWGFGTLIQKSLGYITQLKN